MSTEKPLGRRYKRATHNPDHARRTHVPAPADADIEQRLTTLVKPAVFAELAYYRQLGLRNRILTLPVMVAVVLAMVWRAVPGVATLQRMLARERILWTTPTTVSQPALAERFLTFPAVLFERVLARVLARLPERLAQRTRPLPPALSAVTPRFAATYALDATILEALFRKLAIFRDTPDAPIAGQLAVVGDLASRVPVKLWYTADPGANEKGILPRLLAWLPTNSLVVCDLGYFAFPFFDALSASERFFVTRMREKTSFTVERVLVDRPQVRDRIVHLGQYRSNPSSHPVRLIEVVINGTWYRYLTNVLDPTRLSLVEVVDLYGYRWSIETAFQHVKRLLGLSYLWVGSQNGVELQVWATWLYYAVLLDLCDDVAEILQVPTERISVEMVARSLYFYVHACADGYQGSAAAYLAQEAAGLGIVKHIRPTKAPPPADQIRRALLAFPHSDAKLDDTELP